MELRLIERREVRRLEHPRLSRPISARFALRTRLDLHCWRGAYPQAVLHSRRKHPALELGERCAPKLDGRLAESTCTDQPRKS